MLRFARWKVASILAMTLISILLIVPSLLSPTTRESLQKSLPHWIPARAIVLGLDLQGGAHLLLEVDSSDVIRSQVNNLRDDVRRVLREENVRITGGIGAQGRTVQFRVAEAADRARALPKLRQLAVP